MSPRGDPDSRGRRSPSLQKSTSLGGEPRATCPPLRSRPSEHVLPLPRHETTLRDAEACLKDESDDSLDAFFQQQRGRIDARRAALAAAAATIAAAMAFYGDDVAAYEGGAKAWLANVHAFALSFKATREDNDERLERAARAKERNAAAEEKRRRREARDAEARALQEEQEEQERREVAEALRAELDADAAEAEAAAALAMAALRRLSSVADAATASADVYGTYPCGSTECPATTASLQGAYSTADGLWYCADCWVAYSLQDPDNWKAAFGEETTVDDDVAEASPWTVEASYYDGELEAQPSQPEEMPPDLATQ